MDYVPIIRPRLWKNKADFFKPFRAAAVEAGEGIAPLYDPALHRQHDEEPDLKQLNVALSALIDVFPDVEPEVFREMLLSVSEESRLQVVTEHLLTKKATWARGRFRTLQEAVEKPPAERTTRATVAEEGVAEEDLFRSDAYKKAVRQVFYQEFKNLSHSSIRAVLAEQNFSYTLARPILQQLLAKSWRFSLSALWSRKPATSAASDHPFILWQTAGSPESQTYPAVRRTGNAQLDHELYQLFISPILDARIQAQLVGDYQVATQLNEQEAEAAEALLDCECCYSSVPFEQLSTCDSGCHQLCFDCVRRTVNEALFGQGWARTVDLERSSVRCFSPLAQDCSGVIPPDIARRALACGGDVDETWNEFQQRAATDILSKSRLPLQRCPFCNYAEVDETPAMSFRPPRAIISYIAAHTSEPTHIILSILAATLIIFTGWILITAGFLWLLFQLSPSSAFFLSASWARVHQKRRGLKFHCRSPSCGRASCTRCQARWRDPHACFEHEKTSLRTALEASATAAVKRTCPRCLLSFVKASGCNKLVCNCGYAMCYICRDEIPAKVGYAHFCQHFRPHGGRCAECDRCDLYGDEDEEAAIRRAADLAEKTWRETQGERLAGGDEKAAKAMVAALIGQARGQKTWEVWLDAVVDACAA